MKKLKLGQGFTVFVLFFGIAMFDAFKSGNIWRGLLWVAFGMLFFMSDKYKKKLNLIDSVEIACRITMLS